MERAQLLQPLHARIARLESEQLVTSFESDRHKEIGVELSHLRSKIQDIMNCPCPVIKDTNETIST